MEKTTLSSKVIPKGGGWTLELLVECSGLRMIPDSTAKKLISYHKHQPYLRSRSSWLTRGIPTTLLILLGRPRFRAAISPTGFVDGNLTVLSGDTAGWYPELFAKLKVTTSGVAV